MGLILLGVGKWRGVFKGAMNCAKRPHRTSPVGVLVENDMDFPPVPETMIDCHEKTSRDPNHCTAFVRFVSRAFFGDFLF
jgi:hypothetical protein